MAVVKGDMSGRANHALDEGDYSLREMLGRLFSYVRPHLVLLIVSFVASAVSVVLALWVPPLVGSAIDHMIGVGAVDFDRLWSVLGTLSWVIPSSAALSWLAGTATNRLCHETVRDLREDANACLTSLPFSFLDTHAHGDLLSRVVNDADAVGEGLLQGFTQLFSGICTLVATLCFMLSLSVPVAIVVIVLTPLSILVASLIARLSSKSFTDAQRLQGQISGYTNEMVSNQSLVNAFGRGDAAVRDFSDINAELYAAGVRSQFVSSLSNPTTRLVNNIVYAVVAVVGCVSVVTSFPSPLTVGQVQSFLAYANQFMKPINDISGVATELEAVAGDIVFDHVSFSYDGTRKIIDDVSFHARPAQRFALVGPTGCGKTTLINLLLRFYDPDEGTILLDGVDTVHMERFEVRSAFGMVLQDTWLKSASIKDNIRFGRPEATDDQVTEAAKRSHAHKFIMQLPAGYDTIIDESGSSLSEGQRQLLSIARVMLLDPPILLLDEATSSIDTRTELKVQDAFDRMMEGRTSLVVAHRLSTIRSADCILYMEAGRIVERGTHDELLALGGAYARLYHSQFETS